MSTRDTTVGSEEDPQPPANEDNGVNALVWPPQRGDAPAAPAPASPGAEPSAGQHRLDRLLDGTPATERATSGGPPAVPARSAGQVLARRWWIVLLAAAVVGAATYEISSRLPARYSSSATAAVQVSGSDPNSTTQAANTMAGQFAQQVGAQGVLAAASRSLHVSVSELNAAVSGGVVGGQNLITVQASGSSPQQAQKRAATVTTDFINYVAAQAALQRQTYSKNSQQQLAPINAEIQQVTQQLNRFGPGQQTSPRYLSLQSTSSALLAERAAALASIAQTGNGGYPSITLVSAAELGSVVAPQPKLYAIIGFILALLIVARLVVYFAPHERPR